MQEYMAHGTQHSQVHAISHLHSKYRSKGGSFSSLLLARSSKRELTIPSSLHERLVRYQTHASVGQKSLGDS